MLKSYWRIMEIHKIKNDIASGKKECKTFLEFSMMITLRLWNVFFYKARIKTLKWNEVRNIGMVKQVKNYVYLIKHEIIKFKEFYIFVLGEITLLFILSFKI